MVTLKPTDSIAMAADIFKVFGIHHIPVVDEKQLVGIISKSDFLFFRRGFLDNDDDQKLEEIRMQNYTVSFIMTKGLGKLEPTDKIVVALEIFRKNIFHAIPVVDKGELIGIITTHDIIENLAKDNKTIADYE